MVTVIHRWLNRDETIDWLVSGIATRIIIDLVRIWLMHRSTGHHARGLIPMGAAGLQNGGSSVFGRAGGSRQIPVLNAKRKQLMEATTNMRNIAPCADVEMAAGYGRLQINHAVQTFIVGIT